MKKRIFALMLSCLLAVTSVFGAFADNDNGAMDTDMVYYNDDIDDIVAEYHFEKIASNDRFDMYCDEAAAVIGIADHATGEVWYSAPPINTKELGGEAISSAKSMLYVAFTNPSMVQKYVYSSLKDEVNCTVTKLDNGIRFDYDFFSYKFSIPVTFVLTEDGVEASILVAEIDEYGENTINTIDFMKYFGAAYEGTDGYLVVPDGSGALINFDNGKNMSVLEYSKPFYGDDAAEMTTRAVQTSREEKVTLPVGGLVRGEMSYVDDGALIGLYDANVIATEQIKLAEDAVKDADKAVGKATDAVEDRIKAEEKLAELMADSSAKPEDVEKAQADVTEALAEEKELTDAAKPLADAAAGTAAEAKKAADKSVAEAAKITGDNAQAAADAAAKVLEDAEAVLAEAKELAATAADPVAAVKGENEPAEETADNESEGEGASATNGDNAETDASDEEKPSYGFLFEVTSGAENAILKANTSGNKLVGGFNNIYTNLVYRTSYKVPLKGQTSDNDVLYNAEDPISTEIYTVAYRFSDTDDTDYITLAQQYRKVLEERGWLNEDGVTERFYLELFGAVNKKKSFAGLIYTARETLTTFNEAKAIMEALQTEGQVSNLQVIYSNFSDDYFEGDMEIALDPSDSIGGIEDLKSLIEYAKSINTDIALSADFQSFHSGGNGVSTFWDVADVINVSPIKVYPFALNTNTMDTTDKPYYLLDASLYGETVDTLLESVKNNGYSALYFDEEAVQLYSDLAPDGYQSERTSAAQVEQYARLQAAGIEMTMSNPNAYLFPYADYIVDVPVCSSKEVVFDEDVPFLQAVLRGAKNFAGESMNINDVSDESFLRHLEYGTNLKYSLINAETKTLLKTDMTDLYSATFDVFKDQIIERYAAFVEFGSKVGDASIIAHERMNYGDVAITTYGDVDADGNETKVATVYINYGEEAVTVDDVTIEAMSYVIV